MKRPIRFSSILLLALSVTWGQTAKWRRGKTPVLKADRARTLLDSIKHESPRTTKLYDRTSDDITLDEVERIAI